MHSHKVEYFTGSVAVDMLMDNSPWAKKNVKDPENQLFFEYREHCVDFLDELLKHKMFHRAKKIPVDSDLLKNSKKKTSKETDQQETDDGGNKSDAKQTDKKKKRKIRLDMHLEQIFMDAKDAYVWIYDPTPWYYWVGGSAIVLVIIAICLFPLWPPWMRLGVHYLSIGAAGFLLLIIGLAVLKYIIFAILFALSAGKLKFWIFPNLTEDVGFFESFMPVYDYTYIGGDKGKKKAKDSDDEESDDEEEDDNRPNDEKNEEADQSESDDSTSKKSSNAGKDFEMVDKNDTDA